MRTVRWAQEGSRLVDWGIVDEHERIQKELMREKGIEVGGCSYRAMAAYTLLWQRGESVAIMGVPNRRTQRGAPGILHAWVEDGENGIFAKDLMEYIGGVHYYGNGTRLLPLEDEAMIRFTTIERMRK